MSRKNIPGIIVALVFMLSFVLELTNAPLTQAFRSSFSILLLWVACAYWRYGEGIEDSYNKQQAFIASALHGCMGFSLLRPILDPIIDQQNSLAPTLYQLAILIVFIKIVDKHGMLIFLVPQFWRFILFQTPIQMRKHTRE